MRGLLFRREPRRLWYHNAAPPPPPPEVPLSRLPEYRISPEDVLQISVWNEPDLEIQVIVRPDGYFSYYLVGDVLAAGKTAAEIDQDITSRIQSFVPDAVVTVFVLEIKGLSIYVTGKVNRPGQFELGRYINVLQAIALAGGLTPYASPANIKIFRTEGDTQVVIAFNYNEVTRVPQENIRLMPGDVSWCHDAKSISPRECRDAEEHDHAS